MNAISQSSLSQHIWMQVSISSAIPRRENFPARSSCVRVTLVNIGPCGHFNGRTFVISDSRLSSENKEVFFRHYRAFANYLFKLLYEAKNIDFYDWTLQNCSSYQKYRIFLKFGSIHAFVSSPVRHRVVFFWSTDSFDRFLSRTLDTSPKTLLVFDFVLGSASIGHLH